ncbi:MAG: ABC transporter ATP-binding protein [Spirochaetales bacterium]|nr:ABC transporter ATP-binding protein [Spirochaetales bacterium]
MIKVEGLYHSYSHDDKYAVRDASFEITRGEVFGFLGPSGAGKSTTQGVLTGLLQLQKGNVSVAGYDVKKPVRKMFNKIGVSFEQSNVYGKLTALENLEFYRKLFDVPTRDAMELLEIVGLDHVANQRAAEFSKGMKHRLTFIRSMINNPEIWFLDEPTTGLDPAIASEIKDIIKREKEKGTTVFLTTHNMFVADELCDRVGFIIDGEIKLIDSPRNLKLQYGEKLVEVDYRKNGGTVREKLSFIDESDRRRLNEIVNTGAIEMMHTKEATLEEIFIKVTGRGLE